MNATTKTKRHQQQSRRAAARRAAAGVLMAACGAAAVVPANAQDTTAALPPLAPAPAHLINLDTPPVPPADAAGRGAASLRAEARVFGSEEKITYTTLSAGYTFAPGQRRIGAEVLVRGTLASKRTLTRPGFTLRHGGNDVEILAKLYSPQQPNVAFALGVSLPDTPAQDEAHVSAQILYRYAASPTVSLFLAPKALFIEDNTLVGIGGGIAARLSPTVQFVGDVTGVVDGDNTYDITTGNRRRESVLYGAALRFTPPARRPDAGEISLEVGVTNALGGTTGFSLTPGLDKSVAGYVGLSYRR